MGCVAALAIVSQSYSNNDSLCRSLTLSHCLSPSPLCRLVCLLAFLLPFLSIFFSVFSLVSLVVRVSWPVRPVFCCCSWCLHLLRRVMCRATDDHVENHNVHSDVNLSPHDMNGMFILMFTMNTQTCEGCPAGE